VSRGSDTRIKSRSGSSRIAISDFIEEARAQASLKRVLLLSRAAFPRAGAVNHRAADLAPWRERGECSINARGLLKLGAIDTMKYGS